MGDPHIAEKHPQKSQATHFCILWPQGIQWCKVPGKICIKDSDPGEESAQEIHYREAQGGFREKQSHRIHHSQVSILVTNKEEHSTDKTSVDTVPAPALLFESCPPSKPAGGSKPRNAFRRKLRSVNASSNSSAEQDIMVERKDTWGRKQAFISRKLQITEVWQKCILSLSSSSLWEKFLHLHK